MKQVLVVDDSATMRRMVMASLRGLNEVAFQEAGNGLEAIERLALSTVDLMILDLNMPDMHGLGVVTFVREHQRYRDIPIIVLTTRRDSESRERCPHRVRQLGLPDQALYARGPDRACSAAIEAVITRSRLVRRCREPS